VPTPNPWPRPKRYRSWEYAPNDYEAYDLLPPDLKAHRRYAALGLVGCGALWSRRQSTPSGWVCTRVFGHRGRHAAADGDKIVAVWWP
jgi:hypothetical protein